MSGELRLSQFRWTTTANDDLVIGNPAEAGLHNTKFIVFQATNTPGYAANPHFRCEWNGSAWAFKMNQGGGGGDLALTGMAYLADGTLGTPQTFTGYNTFSGPVIASSTVNLSNNVTLGTTSGNTLTVHSAAQFNSNLTVSGNLTVNGTLTNVNTANLEVTDKLITLNNGGGVASGSGAGIEIEESSAIRGYVKVASDRLGWDLKSPAVAGATRFRQSLTQITDIDLALPEIAGTLALTSDIHAAVTLGTANGLGLSGQQISLGLSSGSTTGALSSTDWTTFNNAATAIGGGGFAHLAGIETFTGSKHVADCDMYFEHNTSSASGDGNDGKIQFRRSATGTAPWAMHAQYFGDIITVRNATETGTVLYTVQLGNGIISPAAQPGMNLTRNYSGGKVSLELETGGSAGSSIILADRVSGLRYELYIASGVLSVALA